MKRKGFVKCLSAVLTVCMVLSCMTFAFTSVGAATYDESQKASTSVTSSSSTGDSFSWDNATVYFLLTDRFKNGNTSNDHSYNRGLDQNGNVVTGIDDRATFHGGDFAGVTQTINDGYFNDLGVNALWISAPYEQIHGYVVGGDSNPSFAHYSYHGYYVLDYTQTDANFGTAQEFETLVDTAHSHGIRVIMDIVMNHSGYNSLYDMNEYGFGTVKSGWESSYYNFNNVSNATYHANIDYSANAADWAKWWGADWIRCGVAGYTEGGGDDLTRSLAGLPDFKTESSASVGIPAILNTKWTKEGRLTEQTNALNSYFSKTGKAKTVTNYLSYWLSSWVRDYGVDGFRCDTAKHVDLPSWNTLKTTCVDALKQWRQNNPDKPGANWTDDFWMTGECWDHGVNKDGYYTQGGFDSMINFSTQGGGLVAQGSVKNTYNGFADSINTDDSFNVLSYISSHDSVLARGNLISTGSAFLMLPGAVQIFYGDETNRALVSGIPFDGNGGAGHSLRSDMNWTSADQSVLEHWKKVGTFRNNHICVGAGANSDLTSSSGYAFGRTYSKNGKNDKIAGCIYASANSDVTIDVSSLWADGQYLVNAYDQTSAVVTNGKVTFNSGSNSTILIEEPDGRPLMSVSGSAKFYNAQTVTVHLQECDSAKCSIDGGNKFVVKDGTTFGIGQTAYAGDTIKITLEAENEKGKSESSTSFLKVANQQDTTEPTTVAPSTVKQRLYVKTWDGSAPYAYIWTGSSTELNGAWPGKQLTQKDADGNYYFDINSQEKYNVVFNNGNGTQSGDLTGLQGEAYTEVTGSNYASKIVSNGSGGGGGEVTEDSVIIRVKSFDGSAPYLYVWTDTKETPNGAWPGKQLTEKDENGNYIFTVENTSKCNAIVNKGSDTAKTGDITDISGDVTIQITNEAGTTYKLTKNEKPLSPVELLKKEARAVLVMTASDYTDASFSTVTALMPAANSLIEKGEQADATAVEDMTTQLKNAKAALKLAQPKLSYAVKGKTVLSGVAVPDADVTVNVNGSTYTAKSDDVTGGFTVSTSALTSSSVFKIDVKRNSVTCDTYSYNMANGDINSGVEPTSPTTPPVTVPVTTQPVTTAPVTTQPVSSQPVTTAPVTTQPVTTNPTDKLTVNATSNFFPAASQTVDKSAGTVTVSYKLTSSMKVENGQWKLSFDSTKLKYDSAKNTSNGSQKISPVIGGDLVYNVKSDYILGNYTNLNLYSFENGADYVTVTFDIIGTGEAKVDLDVQYLCIGYVDAQGYVQDTAAVDDSVVMNVNSVSGFENAKISTSTTFGENIIMGDADGDGIVTIKDATAVMKAAAEKITLTDLQKKCADVDGDGYITIKDATMIQKAIAGRIVL